MTTEVVKTFRCVRCVMKDDEYKTSDQDDIEDHIEEEHPDERVLTSFNIQVDFR